MKPSIIKRATEWFLRIALSAAFLSAVADRFGLWGAAGAPRVAWGDWQYFQTDSDRLNSWMPPALCPPAAWLATLAETLLGVALLIPIGTRWTAAVAGVLLCVFALTMTLVLGIKAPLDYSVWTGAAGAFLLALSDKKQTVTQSASR